MKKKLTPRAGFEDYQHIETDAVTFGTTLFMRNDRRALKIVFPAGQMVTFAPMDEIAEGKENESEIKLPDWVYKLSKKKFAELQRAIMHL